LSDAEELFTTPESEARLDLIRHLIENSELVPLVRGMSGIGKTLLASRLQTSAPKNWVVCHFDADATMQPERLLAQIARCNGLPDVKKDNIQRLVERFELLRNRGSIPVLLIDDAQELPPTSLITLLRLYERQVGGGPLVSLVLFANEQIDMLLSTPQLQIMSPQSIQVIDLPPLTREEAAAFMLHILKVEGLDQSLALDLSRLNRIYRDTQGAPGPLGSAILKEVGESNAGTKGTHLKISKPMVMAGIPVALLFLLLLVFQGPINRLFSPEPELTPAPLVVNPDIKPDDQLAPAKSPQGEEAMDERQPMPDLKALDRTVTTSEEVEEDSTVSGAVVAQTEEVRQIDAASDATQETADVPESTSTEDAGVAIRAGDADSPLVVEESPQAKGVDEQLGPKPESTKIPVSDRQSVAKSETERLAQEPAVEAAVEAVEKSDKPVSQVVKPVREQIPQEEKPVVESIAKGDTSSLLKSQQWLSEQLPGRYTVQLLAAEKIDSIRSVMARYRLQEEAFTIRTERKGRPWYPLLWGVYQNRARAVAAIKRLPPELRKEGAWARSLASLRP
jgi:DamX protein